MKSHGLILLRHSAGDFQVRRDPSLVRNLALTSIVMALEILIMTRCCGCWLVYCDGSKPVSRQLPNTTLVMNGIKGTTLWYSLRERTLLLRMITNKLKLLLPWGVMDEAGETSCLAASGHTSNHVQVRRVDLVRSWHKWGRIWPLISKLLPEAGAGWSSGKHQLRSPMVLGIWVDYGDYLYLTYMLALYMGVDILFSLPEEKIFWIPGPTMGKVGALWSVTILKLVIGADSFKRTQLRIQKNMQNKKAKDSEKFGQVPNLLKYNKLIFTSRRWNMFLF